MTVVIDGKTLTIDKVVEVARNNANISVSDKSWKKKLTLVEKCLRRKSRIMKPCMELLQVA